VEFVTFLALPNGVGFGEGLPMLLLLRREHARALAEGAEALHGGEDGRANELRAVRDALHRLDQDRVGLEGDDLGLLAFHGRSSRRSFRGPATPGIITLYYQQGKWKMLREFRRRSGG